MLMLAVVVGDVMALMTAVAGVLAVATGRMMFPWLRGKVGRPGVWGAGALLLAATLATAPFVSFGVRTAVGLSGLALLGLGYARGRRATPPTE
ncbi:hypothetical protein ACF08B_05240 [Streptomyces sp. NPDC015139]|uniref:hypothetical protein n=1 Tax=Streptomyces sp. NPDC015139 TaxID=3364942 RepID=UPI003701FFB7